MLAESTVGICTIVYAKKYAEYNSLRSSRLYLSEVKGCFVEHSIMLQYDPRLHVKVCQCYTITILFADEEGGRRYFLLPLPLHKGY